MRLGDMCRLTYSDVSKEPVVRDANESGGALVGDLKLRGFWQSQVDCILDVRVVDIDECPSHVNRPVRSVLASAESEKKRKYFDAVEFRRGTFTPFVLSVDGVLGQAAETFVKHLASTLVFKWDKSYSEVMGWMRATLSFSTICATDLCIHGSRRKSVEIRRVFLF